MPKSTRLYSHVPSKLNDTAAGQILADPHVALGIGTRRTDGNEPAPDSNRCNESSGLKEQHKAAREEWSAIHIVLNPSHTERKCVNEIEVAGEAAERSLVGRSDTFRGCVRLPSAL